MSKVKFVEATQEQYDALSTKDSGTLYFTSDTNRIYKGADLYTSTPVYKDGVLSFGEN